MNEKASDATKPYHWGWAALLSLISLVTLAFRYALPVRDSDLWWHMVYGRYFLENRTIVADHTLFSWTPSTNDTIYCTWLPDIFFYLLHHWAGLPGLFAFRYACFFLLLLACVLFARTLKLTSHPVVWFISLTALLMSYTAAFLKPEIISFCLMTLTVWCWFHIRASEEKGWGWCYLFPLIMLIWVNSHGGFVFGIAFLTLAATGEILNTWFSHGNRLPALTRKHLARSLALTALTPFFTPYGYHYPFQLFFDLLPTQENINYNLKISAYFSPFESFTPYHSFKLYADSATAILLFLLFINLKQKTIEWSSLLTNFCFALLYTKFIRTTFFWAPVFALSCIYMLHKVSFIYLTDILKRRIYSTIPICFLSISLLMSGYALKNAYCSPETYLWMGFGISYFNPVEESDYINKYFQDKRIGNTYNEGGYLLWKLWPKNRVLVDARHFPYKKLSDEYFQSLHSLDIEALENFTRKYPADIWCIGLEQVATLLYFTHSNNWHLAYYGKNSALFVKNGIKLPIGAPKVSPEITDIRNLNTAVTVLAFATTIQDWQTTESLLRVIQNNFRCDDKKFLYQWSTILRDAMQSYWAGEYSNAVLKFEILPSLPLSPTQPYLLDSYHRLMAQTWQQNDIDAALILAAKIWTLSGKNIYAAYNLGIIGWYFSTTQQQSPSKIDTKNPSRWRYHLKNFIMQAPDTKDNEEIKAIAQQILDGRFPAWTKPGILVPQASYDRKNSTRPMSE